MSDSVETKVCPWCHSTIPKQAVKCAQCREWVVKPKRKSAALPMFLGFVGMLISILGAAGFSRAEDDTARVVGPSVFVVVFFYCLIVAIRGMFRLVSR